MLSETERRGCLQLLEKMTQFELMTLKDTVTKSQIFAENTQEAMKAIVEYSESALELLRRKKMRRDLLFQYLADCGVIVSVNAAKHVLIQRVLEHWGSSVPSDAELQETDSGASVDDAAPAREVAPAETSFPPATQSSTSVLRSLGESFVRWFYDMWNAENPSFERTECGFGPRHFWENCTLKLQSRTPNLSEESFEGSVLVSQRLGALVKEELLTFNPNISTEGVKVVSDPHGLLLIMVCGTIHQFNNCLGVFEQSFGLVRSPLNEHTWKIKFSQLHISSSQVTATPKLTDSSERQLLALSGSMSVVPHG